MAAKSELGPTLRAWRDRLSPQEVGLEAEARRRAPGLRRQELARLAGVSTEYVVLLEQGRASSPSAQVLAALAKALRLSEAERAHLFRLAGKPVPAAARISNTLPAAIHRLVDRVQGPVAVYDLRWDPVAWNSMWVAVMGDPQARPELERNLARRQFTGLPTRVVRTQSQQRAFEQALVADLRDSSGKYPDDWRLGELVAELCDVSPRFRELWESQCVATYTEEHKTIDTPGLGPLEFDCDILTIEHSDLRVVVYTPTPDSATSARLHTLTGALSGNRSD